MKSDEQIKVDVADHLKWDDRVDASNVSVVVEEGEVELQGHVPTTTAKIAAYEDAHEVKGVISVENDLDIQYPETKAVPNDEDIAFNIKSAFSYDSDLEVL